MANNCAKCRVVGCALRCGKCLQIWYCSKVCQRDDWPKHRNDCVTPLDRLFSRWCQYRTSDLLRLHLCGAKCIGAILVISDISERGVMSVSYLMPAEMQQKKIIDRTPGGDGMIPVLLFDGGDQYALVKT